MKRCLIACVLLGGCEADEFVIYEASDSCSSSGEPALEEPTGGSVIEAPLAEMTVEPAASGPLDSPLPADAPAQERR